MAAYIPLDTGEMAIGGQVTAHSWARFLWRPHIEAALNMPPREGIRIPKAAVDDPAFIGCDQSRGKPVGQVADYRLGLDDGSGLHLRDHGEEYELHRDEVDPGPQGERFLEHWRRDAPEYYVGFWSAVGGAIGALGGYVLTRKGSGAAALGLVGAVLGGLASSWNLPEK